MKQVRFLFILFFAWSTQQVCAQDAAIKTDTIVVKGNCSMCKERIEEACYVPGVKKALWNTSSQKLIVIYKPSKVSLQQITQQIVAVGHDAAQSKASDAAYKKLPDCCSYRSKKCDD
jgi:mercuric ion binding protein